MLSFIHAISLELPRGMPRPQGPPGETIQGQLEMELFYRMDGFAVIQTTVSMPQIYHLCITILH